MSTVRRIPDAPDNAPALRAQLRRSANELAADGGDGSWLEIGRHAWEQLTPQERLESIPTLVATYLHRVLWETATPEERGEVAA